MRLPDRLELIVFICGAVVMIMEFAGSRVVAPFIGTSLYTWTSLIGVILASLSIGYWYGGRLADQNPSFKLLYFLITWAALAIGLTAAFNPLVLTFIQSSVSDLRVAAILAALVLFAPASILLGMVSPFAARLKLKDVSKSGATVGSLYALSTVGSIVGTFASGFFLISWLGTTNLLFSLAGTLLITAILLGGKQMITMGATITPLLLYLTFSSNMILPKLLAGGLTDKDTAYSRVWIFNRSDPYSEEPIKLMQINNESSSAMFLNSDELVFPYTKYYQLAEVFNPDFKHTLLIGGAGYSYPKFYLKQYPQAAIDVVEIDPGITKLAEEHFRLKPDPRLQILHQDGRIYINQTQKKYDIVLGDAFKSYSVPFQLTTVETVEKIYGLLNSNGMVILNLIGSVNGDNGRLVRAEYKTYKEIFPQVYIFAVTDANDENLVQNIMLVALKNSTEPTWQSNNPELQDFLSHRWLKPIINDLPILTDDFAPIEYYTRSLEQG